MEHNMTSIDAANEARLQIKAAAEAVLAMKDGFLTNGEAIANVMLAYRHLEDASMRLGKVIQALDGGVSVYDKRTTVGAQAASA
jgi:hypothetical protein